MELDARGFGQLALGAARQLRRDDLKAHNSKAAPDTVAPRALNGVDVEGGRIRMTLPPASWNTVRLGPG